MTDDGRSNPRESAAPFMSLRGRLMSGDHPNGQRAGSIKARRSTPRSRRQQAIREAVESLTHLAVLSAKGDAKAEVLDAAYTALCINAGIAPGSHPNVTLTLHQRGLLEKASVDHVEFGRYKIDFAWPSKRVALRLRLAQGLGGPPDAREADASDALLREHGWLVFPVDPASKSFDEQLDRAISVAKRMGPYPRRAS